MKDAFKKLINTLQESKVISEEKAADMTVDFDTKLSEYKEEIYTEAYQSFDEDAGKKLEEILEKIDVDHSTKLEEIVETIDSQHSEKLEEVVSSIDADHTSKLKIFAEAVQNKTDEELVENVSQYLDTYLEEVAPEATLINEAKADMNAQVIADIKKKLMITDEFIQEEVKEAISEASDIMKAKDEEINALMIEKVQLKEAINSRERDELLAEETKDMNAKMKAYVISYFKTSTKEEISEKLEEAVAAFKADENSEREKIIAENKNKENFVEKPLEKVINESTNNEVDFYERFF